MQDRTACRPESAFLYGEGTIGAKQEFRRNGVCGWVLDRYNGFWNGDEDEIINGSNSVL